MKHYKHLLPAMMLSGVLMATLPSCSSKIPDSEVKTNVEAIVIPGVTAEVKDGVVTLKGTVSNEADKASVESAVKNLDKKAGVQSVINDIMVSVPAQPVINADDAILIQKVTDATKDYPEISATVKDGIIYVSGSIASSRIPKLKMALDNLHPKKTDLSAITVKN